MPTTLHAGKVLGGGQPHLVEYLPVGYMPWWYVPTAEGFAAVPDVPPGVEINVAACFSSQANLHTTNKTCVEAGAGDTHACRPLPPSTETGMVLVIPTSCLHLYPVQTDGPHACSP